MFRLVWIPSNFRSVAGCVPPMVQKGDKVFCERYTHHRRKSNVDVIRLKTKELTNAGYIRGATGRSTTLPLTYLITHPATGDATLDGLKRRLGGPQMLCALVEQRTQFLLSLGELDLKGWIRSRWAH